MEELPCYSQYLDVEDTAWQPRACGIVALKMVLDYWRGADAIPTADALIKEGTARDGFIPGVGWKHQALVDLAHAHGCIAERNDWSAENPSEAFARLCAHLKNGPIIASIHTQFDPTSSDGHLIVVYAADATVFYHDPAQKERNKVPQETDAAAFIRGWKKRVILISPQKSVHS